MTEGPADIVLSGERAVTVDMVVVWRFADGRIVEVWDIAPGQPTEV